MPARSDAHSQARKRETSWLLAVSSQAPRRQHGGYTLDTSATWRRYVSGPCSPATEESAPDAGLIVVVHNPRSHVAMAYLVPTEFVTKMVDAGESKVFMSTRDTLIRAVMAGALLSLAAVFAVTVTVATGSPLLGAVLFPVGFCMLYLLGFDLLTGVFMLTPLALIDKRPGVTFGGVLRNWFWVFIGNFSGALLVAVMMAYVFTYGFQTGPGDVGAKIAGIGVARTVGYAEYGLGGWFTIFIRGVLCNWMVSTGVVGAMISTHVSGKVIAMWMPIMVFFFMTFEHSVVNMFLFPSALILGGKFSLYDYFVWNEIPTVLGNLVGGITFTGLTLYSTHVRTGPKRKLVGSPAAAVPSQGLRA
jgi:formate transporter